MLSYENFKEFTMLCLPKDCQFNSDQWQRFYNTYKQSQSQSKMEENIEDEEPEFQPCADCDGHDACEDFGCAIKLGLGHLLQPPL